MAFDPNGGQGGQGGGWGGQWPGQPGQPGQPAQPGQPQQGWGQPQQAPQAPPQQAWGQPPQQAPQQPQQPAWGQPPQQAPQQQAWGQPPQQAPQQPGAFGQPQQPQPMGAAPPAWGQPQQPQAGFNQAANSFGAGMNQLGAAVGAGPAPTNAWWPAALVSWWLPGIGLLLLKDKDRKKLAIGSFVGYIAIVVVTSILIGVFASMEVPALPMILSLVLRLVQLVAHFGMLIYTHDETVRAYPHLGSPIFFKNAVNLPANLQ